MFAIDNKIAEVKHQSNYDFGSLIKFFDAKRHSRILQVHCPMEVNALQALIPGSGFTSERLGVFRTSLYFKLQMANHKSISLL